MQRVHIGRTMLVGLLSWLLAFLATLLPDVKNWPSPWATLVPPAVALGVALAMAFVQAAISTSTRGPSDVGGSHHSSSGLSLLAAILLIVLILGIGGVAVSWVTRAAAQLAGFSVGAVPGLPNSFDKNAVERLAKQRTGRSGPLSLTVKSVKQGSRTVRAEVVVKNSGSQSVSLPLYGYCTLAAADGTTLNANAFASQWSSSIPAGGTLSGVLVFDGVFPNDETKAALSFTTVFGPGASDALTVKKLRLKALPP